MNYKLLFVLSFFIIIQSDACNTSQLSDMQEIFVPSDIAHNQKESAHKKYARYLAATPELNKGELVSKFSTESLRSIISFLIVEDCTASGFIDYRAWQQKREQKFLQACVSWQAHDIAYIKENLRLDIWLRTFSDMYHNNLAENKKDASFEHYLDTIVLESSNIWSLKSSKLFDMPSSEEIYALFSYMQQANPSNYYDEIEIAALMLYCNEPYPSKYFERLPCENALLSLKNDKIISNNETQVIVHQAIKYYFIPIIHILLQQGAKFDVEGSRGVTSLKDVQCCALNPIDTNILVQEKFYYIWKVLDQAGFKNDQPLLPCPSREILQAEKADEEKKYRHYIENGRYEFEYNNIVQQKASKSSQHSNLWY